MSSCFTGRKAGKPLCSRLYPSHISFVLSGTKSDRARENESSFIENISTSNNGSFTFISFTVNHFLFLCLYSGVWCVTRHGMSTLQNFLYWWAPSLDTWCSVFLLTGKLLFFLTHLHDMNSYLQVSRGK